MESEGLARESEVLEFLRKELGEGPYPVTFACNGVSGDGSPIYRMMLSFLPSSRGMRFQDLNKSGPFCSC